MKYTYTKTSVGNIIADGENGIFKIYINPYRMSACEFDYSFDDDNTNVTFFDGYAVDDKHQVLFLYKKVADLMTEDTDWSKMDIYDDGYINFFQIQYKTCAKIIKGKTDVENWLRENTNLLAESTYRVSVPLFVLPFLDVKADSEEEAKHQYMMMVEDIICKQFPKGCDVRILDDAWKTEKISMA